MAAYDPPDGKAIVKQAPGGNQVLREPVAGWKTIQFSD